MDFFTLKYEDGALVLLDQTKLPVTEQYLRLTDVEGVYEAICSLRVRGAPAIGVAAAYGMVIAANLAMNESREMFIQSIERAYERLASSRPTAVNLFWALERMMRAAHGCAGPIEAAARAMLDEARLIEAQDKATNRALGENLLSLLRSGDGVLTHCNAGILATSAYGTALSPFYLAKERGIELRVYADETRPLLQGARLTAFELQKCGVDVTLICDSMAASVMAMGRIQAVIVGCDRVAANGDTANKIGTLGVSILARHYGIPLYIAAPTSTIDTECACGRDIPIEERSSEEVMHYGGVRTAPDGIKVYNPAFDVTPNEHISAIVTEKGIVYPPFGNKLKEMCIRQ